MPTSTATTVKKATVKVKIKEDNVISDPPCGRIRPKYDAKHWDLQVKREQDFMSRFNGNSIWKKPMEQSPLAFSAVPYERQRIFMGFEWEFFGSDGNGYTDTMKFYKEDILANKKFTEYMGAYRDEGDIEVMTTPATLAFHKKMMDRHFFQENSLGYKCILSNHKNKTYTDIGLHVHVDLRCFNHNTMAKFLAFYSIPEYKDFFSKLAGRQVVIPYVPLVRTTDPNGNVVISEIRMQPIHRKNVQAGFTGTDGARIDHSRRCHFNLLLHQENTIEIRMFKAPHSKEDLYKKLELVDASVRFTRKTPLEQINLRKFCKFVSLNPKRYPNLLNTFEVQSVLHTGNLRFQ